MNNFTPWLWYPKIWKTEAEFWTYLRGALRRYTWDKSPVKIQFKNEKCQLPPPPNYTGRGKKFGQCEICKQIINKSALEVDHKIGEQSLRSSDDITPFIMHLVPPQNSLQLLCKECHADKTHYERWGAKYGFKDIKEAKAHRAMIGWFKANKGIDKQIKEAAKLGVTFPSKCNEKDRKNIIWEYFKSNV